MKAIVLIAACLAAGLLSLQAQVTVEIDLDQTQFIRNEAIPVTVRISNRAGKPLKIGESPDWLTFNVESRDGKTLSPGQDVFAGGNFDLASAGTVTKVIDIGPAYDLTHPGTYKLTAVARFPSLGAIASSATLSFDVVRGTSLWEEVCGVPDTAGAPQFIRYSLLQSYRGKELKLYLRVAEEPESAVARVIQLGSVVSFAKPEKFIDPRSHLHILYQSGARTYDYFEVTTQAAIVTRKSYESSASRPHLKVTEDGKVGIFGGLLRGPQPAPATNAPPAAPDSK